MNTLEVCCGSLASAVAAVEGGARRIELCSALSLDGLTPSIGLIRELRHIYPDLLIHVLIRPREGDFVYTEAEVRVMERDIHEAVAAGASAIVSGALTPDGDIDVKTTLHLLLASEDLPFTFHRAFDLVADQPSALRRLAALGVRRILTSCGAPTAEAGIPQLRALVQLASAIGAHSTFLPDGNGEGGIECLGLKNGSCENISILPGGGVTSANAHRILAETGATEIHGSCSRLLPDGLRQTSADEVRAVLAAIAS
ncbi:MAG: copper homeostasis protein CutC [Bacteroidaceae bacterium]|nr:copper homeostasis protein CutC [Bacteroidaceae bacterium]